MRNKQNSFLVKHKNIISRTVVMIVIGMIAILTDYLLKIESQLLSELVKLLFSTLMVIAGLWISCYLLFLQLYKDRYPIKVLKEIYLPSMRNTITDVIFCVVYGSVIVIINNGIVANLFYCGLCIWVITYILIKIYQANKSLMVNAYVDKVFNEIDDELKKSKNIIKKETFKNIKYILDESAVKEEYFIIQNISERLETVFSTFVKNSLNFEGENAKTEDVKKSFERIINFNIYVLKLCKNINSEITINRIIYQQIANLEFCIEKNQYELFKKYIDVYTGFLFKTQKEDDSIFLEKLYNIYPAVLSKLIKEDKFEWVKYVDEKLAYAIHSLVFFYDDTGIRSYCNLISGALIFCINSEKEDTEIYNLLFGTFNKFSSLISKTSGSFSKVKMCYSILFNELLKKDYNKALAFYDDVLEEAFHNLEEPILLEFKMYCISELLRVSNDNSNRDNKILNKHIDIIKRIIGTKEKYQGYLLVPDFKKLIEKSQYNNDELENITSKMFELVNNCVIKDNLPMFYALLNDYNDVLLNTEKRQKKIQEELIDVYISLIIRTRALINKQYLEITFQMFENVIKKLDSKRLVSSDLAQYIIINISEVAQNVNKDKQIVVLKAVDLLYSFLDKKEPLNFVLADPEKKKLLYRMMFNIGTDCIENNYEEGLRRVSNSLGWFLINSIDSGHTELTEYLITRAIDLYKISIDMEVSSKTLTFILTLFTTVGTYCCKNIAHTKFLNDIIAGISFVETSKIKTAISLRTSENDNWNSLFDNKTNQLSNKFIATFEQHKAKK